MKFTQAQLARIKALEDTRGRLTAPAVVADAKNKRSPLHGLFNWDLKKAAEAHWLHRAREIIGAVTVQITLAHSVAKSVVYVRDMTQPEGGYVNVASLRSDRDQSIESLRYTLETAAGHLRRAYDLAQPLGLSDQIDHLLQEIAGVRRLIETKAA